MLSTTSDIVKTYCNDGIHYKTDLNIIEGWGIIIFNSLDTYVNEIINNKKHLLGINPNGLVGEITDFYPNGSTKINDFQKIEQYMRKGNGSKLLQEMTKDAISKEADLLYVKTDQDSMKNFLKQKQFYEIPSEKPSHSNFYKLI